MTHANESHVTNTPAALSNQPVQECSETNVSSAATSLDTTRHIHNILSTAPQLGISQKALGTLPEYGNVMPKHLGATIHN